MNLSVVAGCVGALCVIGSSVVIAAEPRQSFCSDGDASWASSVFPSEQVVPAPMPERAPLSAFTEFTRIDDAEAAALLSPYHPVGPVAAVAEDRTIACVELTIHCYENPETGISAIITIRGRDLDGNGKIEAEGTAGAYNIFFGEDEVEQCVATFYHFGSVDAVQRPVAFNGTYQDASFFLFQWTIGDPTVESLDTGSDSGPWISAGGFVSSFNSTSQGNGPFPSYDIFHGPCVCEAPVCTIDGEPREGELDFGFFGAFPHDTTNGGCFSEGAGLGFLATPIAVGERLAGETATTNFGRDTDWYQFTLDEPGKVIVRTRSTFDMQTFLIHLIGGSCGDIGVLDLGISGPCTTAQSSVTLDAGTYIVFCAPSFDQQVRFGADYQLELIDPGPCDAAIYDADAVAREDEPGCEITIDTVNGGCNTEGFPTTPIALGDKLRGTVFSDDVYRDTDWHLLTLTRSTVVTCTATAEFPFQFAIIRSLGPNFCDANRLIQIDGADACGTETLYTPVPPGTYVVAIAPQFFGGVPCGSRYQIELTGTPIDCPGDINLSGATTVADFNILASNFAGTDKTWGQGDLTGDGRVTVADFNVLAGDFQCPN